MPALFIVTLVLREPLARSASVLSTFPGGGTPSSTFAPGSEGAGGRRSPGHRTDQSSLGPSSYKRSSELLPTSARLAARAPVTSTGSTYPFALICHSE